MTPYESGPLSPEQVYELELSSRSPTEFLQIRPAVIAELVRGYRGLVEPPLESKRQFWATRAHTVEREREIRIAREMGLELFDLKSQVEALGVANTPQLDASGAPASRRIVDG